MQQEPPSARNNGKSSDPTNPISKEKILQGLGNQAQNQERIMRGWQQGHQLKNGRYILKRKLTRGGFADIYLATDTEKNQDVALKILKEELRNESDFDSLEENFIKEGMNLRICQHPHIVKFKDIIKTSEGWCLVMEYIEGEDLKSWVAKKGPLSEIDALRYIRQIGEALIEVHHHKILHRDVKPINIIRRADGLEAVLIDFGIARKFSRDKTEQHTPYLTEDFAPIEQYLKTYKRGTHTDVYALAATLYFLLTAKNPIPSIARQEGEPLPPPQRSNKKISPQVNNAILKGMELLPHKRPKSIQEWLDLLVTNERPVETQLIVPVNQDETTPPTLLRNQRDTTGEMLVRAAFMGVAIWLGAITLLKLKVDAQMSYVVSLLFCVSLIFLTQYRLPANESKSYLFISAGIPTLVSVGLYDLTKLSILNTVLLTIGIGTFAFTVMAALKSLTESDDEP